jgi:flagellin
MSLIVNTNLGSLNAQRSLAASSADLKMSMERLSSGSRINSASDDAAGFAIAERMTAQIRGLNMAAKNTNDALSMLAVAESASSEVTDMLQRIRELAVQAVSDTNTDTDRVYLQSEAEALISEVERVGSDTQFNGQSILASSQTYKFQVGTESAQTVDATIYSLSPTYNLGNAIGRVPEGPWSETSNVFDVATTTNSFQRGDIVIFGTNGTGWSDTKLIESVETNTESQRITLSGGVGQITSPGDYVLQVASYDYETQEVTGDGGSSSLKNIDLVNDASGALETLTNSIDTVSSIRAGYGALQNRLEYTVSNLMNVSEFTTAARSRIADADFAVESARLVKAQVLQQSGTAMLAQANASSQLALSLIR